eukprot:4009102-Amphidinium_carterae.1
MPSNQHPIGPVEGDWAAAAEAGVPSWSQQHRSSETQSAGEAFAEVFDSNYTLRTTRAEMSCKRRQARLFRLACEHTVVSAFGSGNTSAKGVSCAELVGICPVYT